MPNPFSTFLVIKDPPALGYRADGQTAANVNYVFYDDQGNSIVGDDAGTYFDSSLFYPNTP